MVGRPADSSAEGVDFAALFAVGCLIYCLNCRFSNLLGVVNVPVFALSHAESEKKNI